jgi:hypothetical protein
VNQKSTTATSAKNNIIPDCSTSTANVNGDGKSDPIPECPNSTAPDVGENVCHIFPFYIFWCIYLIAVEENIWKDLSTKHFSPVCLQYYWDELSKIESQYNKER